MYNINLRQLKAFRIAQISICYLRENQYYIIRHLAE